MYTNADQLQNKMDELLVYVDQYKPCIIMVTEVLPKYNKNLMFTCETVVYNIDGYDLFPGGNGGRGVNIYIKHNNFVRPLTELNEQYHDASWCSISDANSNSIILGCIYRSPVANENTSLLINNLLHQASQFEGRLLITGDFNYPGIDWSDWTTVHTENHVEFLFIECLRDNFLQQHSVSETRFRDDQEPSCIDLVISDNEFDIEEVRSFPSLGHSDHCVLLFQYCFSPPKKTVNEDKTYLKYDKCDYVGFSEEWSKINWEYEFKDCNIDDIWETFKCKYYTCVDKFVPRKTVKA